MVKTVCRYIFSSSKNREANIGGTLKKALERKNASTWRGGGRPRGQKSLRKHFNYSLFVFITLYFHSVFTFTRF